MQNRPQKGAKLLEIRLFGVPAFLRADGEPATLAGRKDRALLAYLAANAGVVLSRDRLVELIWPDAAEGAGRASLRQSLSTIRKALGNAAGTLVTADRDTLTLGGIGLVTDLSRFEAIAAEPGLGDEGSIAFDGSFLDGLSGISPEFDSWRATEQSRLSALAGRLLGALAERAETERRFADAAALLTRALAIDPMAEAIHRRLMRVYAAQGRADAALWQFRALEVLLETELGVGPEWETLELARGIRARRHGRGAPPPASGSPAVTPAGAETEAAKTDATLGAPSTAERRLPDKPSIAVLPFINLSGDPEQEFFADGLTEDIITALSHYRWFFVIARNSSFAYRGRALDVKQIARELGVRYVVEGSVRKAGDRVRVTGQLIDAETGAHLWADRYDRDLADIFAIQDELTQHVVGAIEPEILMGEGRRAVRRPTENLDAYECHMRGMWHHTQGTAEDLTEAIRWYRQAIALDPGFGRAHMLLARSVWATCHYGYSGDIARDIAEMHVEAARAVALDDRDPYAHYVMFGAHLLHGRLYQALAEARRVIDLNPNFALGYMALGRAHIYLGHFAEAMGPLHTALKLSPHDPSAHLLLVHIAQAHYHLGNYEEAANYAQRAHSLRHQYFILLVLLASLGQLGRTEEARSLLPEVAAATPADTARYWEAIFPYADVAHRADLIDGLRKAGLSKLP